MSDLHQQIFVAEYAASRSKGLTPQHALALAWNAFELLADSAEVAKVQQLAPAGARELDKDTLRALLFERGAGEPIADSTAAGIRWLRRAWQAEAKALVEQSATMAACERLLAQARAVMLGELELEEGEFHALLAEISSVIDEQEVER